KTKDPRDVLVGSLAFWVVVTPDGKTAFVTNNESGTVSTIDVKTKRKDPSDIAVGGNPKGVAGTPEGRTAVVTQANAGLGLVPVPTGNSVSTIDAKTRTTRPSAILVGNNPINVAVTPDGKTAFVTNSASDTVSTIDVKTGTKEPSDIAVGAFPIG